MLLHTILKVALKSLLANKLRSFLAMLGIIIGVGAVISMLALGAGAKQQVMERVTSMGSNLLIVRPGGRRRHGVRSGSRNNLTLSDAKAILENIEDVESLAPVVWGRSQVKYFNENTSTSITGTSDTYFKVRNFVINEGRAFSAVEEIRASRVAVIGALTREELFGTESPIGKNIRVGTVSFLVIGSLKAKGDQGWYNPDSVVIIPYSTAMKRVIGQDHLSEIDIQLTDNADMEKTEASIKALLRKRHKLQDDKEDDFYLRNQAEWAEKASEVAKTFTVLLAGIASISLVVGGIGIMNIMLVTVTERTREIGVRKAIGARDRDILRQFLFESVLVSALGGLLGIILGYGVSKLIEHFSDFTPLIQVNAILLSILVSGSVGVIFGYLPARRAAKLDPIEALRYE